MSVTASRLGSAPLTFDWSNLIRVPATPTARARVCDITVEVLHAMSRNSACTGLRNPTST